MCGENVSRFASAAASTGSPPRVRGKQQLLDYKQKPQRITPACAGKTIEFFYRMKITADHPRVCGENRTFPNGLFRKVGSPPRVRGKPIFSEDTDVQARITPACAGKTRAPFRVPAIKTDHPRVCGENSRPSLSTCSRVGSPPRVRGKHAVATFKRRLGRITPACAGKTSGGAESAKGPADHPRVCGENAASLSSILTSHGSPPRVRGKRNGVRRAGKSRRITPACAGKTTFIAENLTSKPDHPRVCGENTSEMAYFRG